MAVLGAHQTVIALDGSPLTDARRYVPRPSARARPRTPSSRPRPRRHASNAWRSTTAACCCTTATPPASAACCTFLTVAAGTGGGDTAGPVTSDVAYAAGTLTATVNDTATGGSNIAAAEYFVDTVGAPGAGTAMTAANAPFDSRDRGSHRHGDRLSRRAAHALRAGPGLGRQLGRLQLGAGQRRRHHRPGDEVPDADPEPPATARLAVAVHATGDDTASGGSNIVAAEYFDRRVGTPR